MIQIGKVLQNSSICCLKTNCFIPFKLTAFVADIHRCLHVNFLNNWLSVKDDNYCHKLNGWGCSCVLWVYRNTMHLEILKIIKFNAEYKRPLGIVHLFCLHFIAFIARFYSLANSGELSYVGLHLVGLCLVGLHSVGLYFITCLAYLTLKTIILDHA